MAPIRSGFPAGPIGGNMGHACSHPPENHPRRNARRWRSRPPDLLFGLSLQPPHNDQWRSMGQGSTATRTIHLRDAQHEPVGAFADVAGLDKTRKRHGISRPRQHTVRDPCRLRCRRCETRSHGSDHHGGWKYLLPTKLERRHAKPDRGDGGNRQDRFMISSEIERDAGAEGDRHPGQQAAGASFGASPFAQPVEEGRPRAKTGRRKATRPCRAPRRPGSRNSLRPTRRPAPFCHPVTLRYVPEGYATLTCRAGKSRTDAESPEKPKFL